uniref:Uncharacterized protein n=1 Tax=Vitis vinifera TaxID=29760 RepID=A5ASD6_VITVI|nr:hypothetical protein VITISV_000523 [Vitis vinifera]
MIVPAVTVTVAVEEEEVVVVKGGLRYSALGVTQKGKTFTPEELQIDEWVPTLVAEGTAELFPSLDHRHYSTTAHKVSALPPQYDTLWIRISGPFIKPLQICIDGVMSACST